MNQPIFTIEHLDKSPEQVKIPGYFIASTAPINIEGEFSRSSELNRSYKRTYSNSHSYEVHNFGILGKSNPPLAPPKRGIHPLFPSREGLGVGEK